MVFACDDVFALRITEVCGISNIQVPTYDPNKWVKAAEACKLCIDEAEKAGYKLYVETGPTGEVHGFPGQGQSSDFRFDFGNGSDGHPYHGDETQCRQRTYLVEVVLQRFP